MKLRVARGVATHDPQRVCALFELEVEKYA
jgi:hypothetical protein